MMLLDPIGNGTFVLMGYPFKILFYDYFVIID